MCGDSMECAGLTALCLGATCRALSSGEVSPHSKNLLYMRLQSALKMLRLAGLTILGFQLNGDVIDTETLADHLLQRVE